MRRATFNRYRKEAYVCISTLPLPALQVKWLAVIVKMLRSLQALSCTFRSSKMKPEAEIKLDKNNAH